MKPLSLLVLNHLILNMLQNLLKILNTVNILLNLMTLLNLLNHALHTD